MLDERSELPGNFMEEINKWALECKYNLLQVKNV